MNYKKSDDVALLEVATYINEKIDSSLLNNSNYVSTENMLPNKGGLVRAESIPSGKVNRFLKNDILVSNIRPYFKKIWYADKNGGCSADVLTVRSSIKVYSRYLYYVLMDDSFFEYSMKGSKGTKMPRGDKWHIMNYPIRVPSYKTQEAIANILSSLDDKINLNNKINRNLETLAQTLYKHWFVDFEFPNESGEPYKSSGGEMVDSELGLIPKGWEVKEIQNIAETILGGTPSRSNKDYWGSGFQWLKSGELNNFRIIKGTEEITKLGLKNSATKLMPIGTTLIAITGYVGLVSMLEIEACANQSVVGIIPNEAYPRSFLYPLIKNEIGTISLKQTGSAQQHINKNDINTHKVISPTHSIISRYAEIAESIHKKIANNLFQNQKLAELRDTLLPKLMNGEIEVPV